VFNSLIQNVSIFLNEKAEPPLSTRAAISLLERHSAATDLSLCFKRRFGL
jgi:hypothetical protein